ncbi:MAG: YkgJ family cysteine cluster protein [Candidatus Bathyarchaeia archaeon]
MSAERKRQQNFFSICNNCEMNCCQHARPPITARRQKTIEKYLKKLNISIENPFVKAAYTFPREDADGYCIFYDKESRKCLVHPVKPETCVAGPITFDINLRSKKIEWYLKTKKICCLAGVLYENSELFKEHLKRAKKEILRLVRDLESEALKSILRIEEPETFKIGENNVGKEVLAKLLL